MTKNPLQLIETPPPQFTEADACRIALRHYGLKVKARSLVSERDQNFRLTGAGDDTWVLKIANAEEHPQTTGFQIDALRHVAQSDDALAVPRVQLTVDGKDRLVLEQNGRSHLARVVSWVDGTTLDTGRLNAAVCRNLGAFLARLGVALAGFKHAGGSQALLWDLRQAPALRTLLPSVAESALRDLLADCLDGFETVAKPALPKLRAQVIHNDFNPDNILMDPRKPEAVGGVIDFGDLQRAPLIIDVAIGASYLRSDGGDPLSFIAEFIAGYHAVNPLEREEIDVLYDLISTRLATTIAILAWRARARESGDSYLNKAAASEGSAAPFLDLLRQLPRADVTRRLRQVCASISEARNSANPLRPSSNIVH